ncbi:hypothetical protein CHS0354_031864 [Potamilus streckersoni]|uniref:Ras-associating domain-containing protein n=1 Tax=Potamilus streckersoni TaxID=2493646 RepID=A0AAE0VLR1_9BIVA|nr:hypothetical protein CHS0354_031864 [Potamilus streckersoni]
MLVNITNLFHADSYVIHPLLGDGYQMQTISVLVEGSKCYMKVTKNTTCGDVIQHLLNYNGLKENEKDSYFLIVSNNITEKQLSNNANILNVSNDLNSKINKIHFIMRKKAHLFVPKISIAKRRRLCEKSSAKEEKVEKVASNPLDTLKYAPQEKVCKQIRGVKRLYQLVQVQKRRLSEMYQKLNGTTKFLKQTMGKKTIDPRADNSLDQFLTNVNKENMQGFLNFCDEVAIKEMENLSSVVPTSSSVDRSVMHGHVKLMPHTFESSLVEYKKENKMVNENSLSELNNAFEDVTNDVLILDDKPYHRSEGEGHIGAMALPPSRSLTIADPSRMRRNEKLLQSTPIANKTMTYLNKSIKQSRMMRQFGSTRVPLEPPTNLQLMKIPRCDSSLKRRPDGDLSMFISHRKPALSSQEDKCKYFWEQSYVSDSDDSFDQTFLDKGFDDAILDNFDDKRNDFMQSPSSLTVFSSKLPKDHDHPLMAFDKSPREFPHVHDVQQEANDGLNIANLKKKLVNYSLSDSDISSLSCESVGISCDCKKTPCATFTRDYVTRFGYSPESGSHDGPSCI